MALRTFFQNLFKTRGSSQDTISVLFCLFLIQQIKEVQLQTCQKKVDAVKYQCLVYRTTTGVNWNSPFSCPSPSQVLIIRKAFIKQINVGQCPTESWPPQLATCQRADVTRRMRETCNDKNFCSDGSLSLDVAGSTNCPEWHTRVAVYLEVYYRCEPMRKSIHEVCRTGEQRLYANTVYLTYSPSTTTACHCGITIPRDSEIVMAYMNGTDLPLNDCDRSVTVTLGSASWDINLGRETGYVFEACRQGSQSLQIVYSKPTSMACDFSLAFSGPASESMLVRCDTRQSTLIIPPTPPPTTPPTQTPPPINSKFPPLITSQTPLITSKTPMPSSIIMGGFTSTLKPEAVNILEGVSNESWVIVGVIAVTFLIIIILVLVGVFASKKNKEKQATAVAANDAYNVDLNDLHSDVSQGNSSSAPKPTPNEETYYNYDMDTQRQQGNFMY